jgi:hypothetical protein
MVGGVKAYYAVLLALVLGVGCGGGKEKAAPKTDATPKAKVKAAAKAKPNIVLERIREHLGKPTGELTKADYEKVKGLYLSFKGLTNVKGLEKLTQLTFLDLEHNQLTNVNGLEKLTKLEHLNLEHNQLTDVKGLEKLTQLTELILFGNPALTKAQIAELKKALPKCKIWSNPTK